MQDKQDRKSRRVAGVTLISVFFSHSNVAAMVEAEYTCSSFIIYIFKYVQDLQWLWNIIRKSIIRLPHVLTNVYYWSVEMKCSLTKIFQFQGKIQIEWNPSVFKLIHFWFDGFFVYFNGI